MLCLCQGLRPALLRDLGCKRDIELGFVGSTQRRLRTQGAAGRARKGRESGGDAHQFRRGVSQHPQPHPFFVSADVGMGEYMIKNFEAMACGCVLLAYDQGEEENRALGFVDMENLVLYRTVVELRDKLAQLRADPAWQRGLP